MSELTIGSLCSGYGGLDLAVEAVLDARTAWVSDIDKGACKVLAHRFPDAPNIGDMTAVDWAAVEPVDVITGGTPCQDLSHAGRRAGMTEGTRSNLWVAMREAIATIRPSLVIWENVDGAASAEADSDLERDPGLLAGVRRRHGEPVLRALGRVVGDLSSLGYVGSVGTVRASDVGAPHRRTRRFLVACPANADSQRRGSIGRIDSVRRDTDRCGRANGLRPAPESAALLGTPRASEWKGTGPAGSKSHQHMLKRDYLAAQVVDLASRPLLPTPSVADVEGGRKHRSGKRSGELLLNGIASQQKWGPYAAAITHWEMVFRAAPAPTETGPKGNPRLSPRFTEWMMGLPAGWITDVPDVTRNEALKLCGNGVVPQQAEAAIRFLLPVIAGLEVAA